MEPFDFEKLKIYNSIAASMAFRHRHALAHHAQVCYPDQPDTHLDPICQKLGLDPKPGFLVVDDAIFEGLAPPLTQNALGFYHPIGHFILLRESVYKGLQEGKAFGEYITSHEAGHATERPTRRRFMQMAASGAAGVAAGGAGYWATTSPDTTGPTRRKSTPTENITRFVTAAMAAMLGMHATKGYLSRIEEFRADKMARNIMDDDHRYVIALSEMVLLRVERDIDKLYVEKHIELANKIIERDGMPEELKQAGITHEQYATCIAADFLCTAQNEPLNFSRIISGQSYPSAMERLQKARADGLTLGSEASTSDTGATISAGRSR